MARQLLQDRTPAAYAGVEGYARRHAKEDAGALAWLVAGYGHILDRDYVRAIDALNRAKPRANLFLPLEVSPDRADASRGAPDHRRYEFFKKSFNS